MTDTQSVMSSVRTAREERYMKQFRGRKINKFQLRAAKRLMRDLKAVYEHPLVNVTALPLEDNLFLWHANIRGPEQTPFEGGVFHIVMDFPETYPDHPPQLTIENPPEGHPFVIGTTVCLSLLATDSTTSEPYSKWSSAYTVQSILLQLQSFLVDGLLAASSHPSYAVEFSQKQQSEWKTVFDNKDQQGEGTLRPSEIADVMIEIGERKPSPAELGLYYQTLGLSTEQKIDFATFLRILKRKRQYRNVVEQSNRYQYSQNGLNHKTATPDPPFRTTDAERVARACDKTPHAVARAEAVCYHSKVSFEQDCLGVGLSIKRNHRTGGIRELYTVPNYISLRSFRKELVRKSADHVFTFTHWLPMYINGIHGPKAMHLAKRAVAMICTGNTRSFKPEMVLEVLPRLLSAMLIQVVNGKPHEVAEALDGFCMFHRLFLAFVADIPSLRATIEERMAGYIADAANRRKDVVENAGEFWTMLSVCDVAWADIQEAALDETLVRNVLWIVKEFPELNTAEANTVLDADRAEKSFEACATGYKLQAVHRFFNTRVAHRNGPVANAAAAYDELYGRPPPRLIDELHAEMEAVHKLTSFEQFFEHMGIPVPPPDEFVARLREAVATSTRLGYHVRTAQVQDPQAFVRERLKAIKPLPEMCEAAGDAGALVPVRDEARWREMAEIRWGIRTLPLGAPVADPWRAVYLRENLQEMISKINENPDFKQFYQILELSASVLEDLEFPIFTPTGVKSGFHFVTALLTHLNKLARFKLLRGEEGLGPRGCKALTKGLKNNPNTLRVLDLEYTQFGPESVEILESGLLSAEGLQTLDLQGNPLGHQGAVSIAKVIRTHHSLTELNLDTCQIPDSGAAVLADALYHNGHLVTLKIGKNDLTGEGLGSIFKALAYSSTIETIDATRIAYASNTSSSNLAKLSNALIKLFEVSLSLKTLNLWQTPIASALDNDVFHGLGKSRSVTSLDFAECGLQSRQAKELGYAVAMNKSITFLSLEGNESFADFAGFYNAIYDIDPEDKIFRTKDEQDREALRPRGCSLRVLLLRGVPLGSFERKLGNFVAKTTTLQRLDLERTGLGVGHGQELGRALTGHPSLEVLNLKGNALGEHGAKKLARGLAANSVLRVLDLSHNAIGGRGAKAVGAALEGDACALRELSLFGNLISIEGARAIGESLAKNRSLTMLDLGLNRIRDKGVLSLAPVLAANNLLETLKLKLNFIKDHGAVELAKAIASNKSTHMRHLAYANNKITNDALIRVVETLAPANVTLDLAELVRVTDPERMAATVLCSPLPSNTNANQIKKIFYDNNCGAIANVTLKKFKETTNFAKSCYAFVEFANADSVDLAIDLSGKFAARIGKTQFSVVKATAKGSEGAGGPAQAETTWTPNSGWVAAPPEASPRATRQRTRQSGGRGGRGGGGRGRARGGRGRGQGGSPRR